MGHVHHALDYVELPAPAASTAFYTAAFGWEFNDCGGPYAGIHSPDGDARSQGSTPRG